MLVLKDVRPVNCHLVHAFGILTICMLSLLSFRCFTKPWNLTFPFHRKSRCWVAAGTYVQMWMAVLWLKRWIQCVLCYQGCFSTSVQIDPIHKSLLDSEILALICFTWWDLKQLLVLLFDVCFRSCSWVFACCLKWEISPKIYLTVLKLIGLQSSWSLIPLEMGAY